ncbi:hypothetical protein [Mycobacterium dioxanotrophicus]|jgi:hypothetical protein|uniref:hypothetical protein n=1 Tax=Mycobacterium dioxanotrophicus TaxID=482462 RepID=UPI0012F71452|nr:hypothetical protein [Mycobacterium dioxanotrophicus]
MSDGYWVVSVNRDTGEATTSERITSKDEAWEEAARREQPNIFTTVVPRRHSAPRRDQP